MIQIGEGIVVKIIHTGRSTVKIGIDAPQDVRVMRAELCPPSAGNRLHELLQERRSVRSETIRSEATMTSIAHAAHAACEMPVLLAK
jgi:carbon storage regulator CsrA